MVSRRNEEYRNFPGGVVRRRIRKIPVGLFRRSIGCVSPNGQKLEIKRDSLNEPRVTAFWQAMGHDALLLRNQRNFRLIPENSRIHSGESNQPTFARDEFSPRRYETNFDSRISKNLSSRPYFNCYRISTFTFFRLPTLSYFTIYNVSRELCYSKENFVTSSIFVTPNTPNNLLPKAVRFKPLTTSKKTTE